MTATCRCVACCYPTGGPSGCHAKSAEHYCTVPDRCDSCDPPAEAAAFVASVTAAVFVLLAALLAVVLSSAAVLTFVSMVPMAGAAADVPVAATVDYHRYQWQSEHQQQLRQKRQLIKNRDPGIISLTFSLIGGTITDVKQAYRNVSGIVQETLAESVRGPTSTVASTGSGDQTMAAGNAVENEIGGSATTTTAAVPPVDQQSVNRELSKLLGRNYRGLRRLFDSELRSAIKSSPGNVRDFALELIGSIGQSLRPSRLFTRGPGNGTATATTGNE